MNSQLKTNYLTSALGQLMDNHGFALTYKKNNIAKM